MLTIHERPMSYFIGRLQCEDHFALPGYSDAEWYCIMKYGIGKLTGLGQVLDESTGERLLEVLKRRWQDPNFIFAVPKVLWELEDCISANIGQKIEAVLQKEGTKANFCERDMITDDLAKKGDLYPFIKQLQSMAIVVVGNKYLRGLDFISPQKFVEVSTPNCHLESQGIERAAEECITYGKPAIYLVSAGLSAPLIIDQIYDRIPDGSFIDCGSIWDAFVGIGSQRGWRRELYADPTKLKEWRHVSLHGKD